MERHEVHAPGFTQNRLLQLILINNMQVLGQDFGVATTFDNIMIGQEFLWGAYFMEEANWGVKRSNSFAECRYMTAEGLGEATRLIDFDSEDLIYVED